MTRPHRIDEPGSFHHLTNRGRNRQTVFLNDGDYECFLVHLAAAADTCKVEIHAYALMSNHYHLLVRSQEGRLSKMMQLVGGGYTQDFNARHGSDGALFKGRFFSKLIRSERHLVETMRYVPNNPVKAGLARRAEDYRWSNYSSTIGVVPSPHFLESKSLVSEFFAGDADAFADFVHREDTELGALVAHVLDGQDSESSLEAGLARGRERSDRYCGLVVRSSALRSLKLALEQFVCESFAVNKLDIADPLTTASMDARLVLLVLFRVHGIAPATNLSDAFGLSPSGARKADARIRERSRSEPWLSSIIDAGSRLGSRAA